MSEGANDSSPEMKSVLSQSPNPFVSMIDRAGVRSDGGTEDVAKKDTPPSSSTEPGSTNNNGFAFHPEFVAPGANPIRIPPDDFINTLVGFNNMYLAHEICLNPEYKLERAAPSDR